MVDLSEGSDSEDMSNKTPDRVSSDRGNIKTCADCGTTKTPLWRGGPAGPKSLCNACGIKSRKRRRDPLGVNKAAAEDKKSKRSNIKNQSSRGGVDSRLGDSLRSKLLALGGEVVLQRLKTDKLRRRQLGEEEQAAVLLMAMSCGSVYG